MKKNSILIFCMIMLFMQSVLYAQKQDNQIIINTDMGKEKINRHIYGHFSEHLGHCIYGGFWVGENSTIPNTLGIRNDVVKALKDLNIPNLRWPGGCFADEYHWQDGIGPRDKRPKMINTHWGGVTEDNSFGTHEFLTLCEQLNCEPVICGNLGSGTVQEMSQWVEYINSDNISPMTDLRKQNGRDKAWSVKFWGIGNENWGCGGNMTAEYYADNMRRYSTYCRNYGKNQLYKIAGGPSSDDYNWMEVLMKSSKNRYMFDAVSLHHYTICHDWSHKGSATQFAEDEWITSLSRTLFMDELITKHSIVMDKYDPEKRKGLVVDEWGNWFDVEPGTNPGFLYQQNSLRDALVAAINLNIFNNHCDRVQMANIAQTVNVLQSVILTKDDKIVLTPTYQVFKMYKVHHDATLLPTNVVCDNYTKDKTSVPSLHASTSKDSTGLIHLTVANLDANTPRTCTIDLRGMKKAPVFARGQIITAAKINAFNDFGKPEEVSIADFKDVKVNGNTATVVIPSKSVLMIEFK